MVQIPQYVQQEGLAAPSRDIPSVAQPTDGGIGQALSSLGNSITNVAQAAQARQKSMAAFNTRVAMDTFQEQAAQTLTVMERNQQGDGAGLHDGFMNWYKENSSKVLATITDPELRAQTAAVLNSSGAEHWSNQAANSEWKVSNTYTVDQLGTASDRAKLGISQNPGTYDVQVKDIEERIKTAPNLTAEQRQKMLDDLHTEAPKYLAAGVEQSDPETFHFLMGLGTHQERLNFLTRRVMQAESGGDPSVVSPTGAVGLMQVQPETAAEIAKKFGDQQFLALSPSQRVEYLKNPANSVRYGQAYLGMMVDKYHGDVEAALVAYNAGPGNADKWLAAGRDYKALPKPEETQPYVSKVLDGMGPAKFVSGAVSIDQPGAGPVYVVGKPAGMVKQGNIDLTTRPHVKNPDGGTSTVLSASYSNDKGQEVLIPLVSDEGKIMTMKEAIPYWGKKGQNLGVFENPEAADKYAQGLHEQQATTLTAAEKGPQGTKTLDIVTGYQGGRQALSMDLRPELVQNFKLLQGDFGQQIPIVSGYRDRVTNAKAGGVNHSQHMEHNAIDLDVSNMSIPDRKRLIQMASARGFTGIGIYKNSIHLDMRAGQPVAWGSDHHAASVPAWAFAVAARHRNRKYSPGTGTQVADASGTGGLPMNDAAPSYADGVPGGGTPRSGFVSPLFEGMKAADYLNMQHDAATGYAKAEQAQLAQSTADKILADAGATNDKPADRAAAYKMLDGIGDAELKKDVTPLVESHFTRWDQVQKDQAKQALDTTWNGVNQALDQNDVGAAFTIAKHATIPEDDRQKMLDRIAKGPVQNDDPRLVQSLDALRFSNPQQFMNIDFRKVGDLTNGSLKSYQELQAKMKEDASKATTDQIKATEDLLKSNDAGAVARANMINGTNDKANAIITQYFGETGIETKADKATPADIEHANKVRSLVSNELEVRQSRSKTPLTITEIQDAVDSVMKTYPRTKPIEGSWLPWKKADADVNMSEVLTSYGDAGLDPDAMATALRKKGMPVNAQTLQQMLDTFNAQKAAQ